METVKVLGATPEVIDTIKKASIMLNSSKITDEYPNVSKQDVMENDPTSLPTLIPAKVISGNGIDGYLCNIFGNGLSQPATSQGTIFLANGASSIFSLPEGTILFVQKISIPIQGSTL